jgi:hypothetical protein
MKQTWDVLEEALSRIDYRREPPPDGRRFDLTRIDEENYARLLIFTYNPNTYEPERMRWTQHEFIVPVATYHLAGWVRWVFDRIASIELHETTEHFFVDGARVYAPHHGNGWDPYTFWPGHDVSEKTKAPGED